jgi:tRNA 2-thiouridine synthesizing protein E
MTTRTYAGVDVDVDAEGFLTQSTQWTREIAAAIAAEAGIPSLGDRHWKVIDFVRADYAAQGQSPGPRRIVAGSGVSMKELYELFPKGPGKLVARIAGVPKPKACL